MHHNGTGQRVEGMGGEGKGRDVTFKQKVKQGVNITYNYIDTELTQTLPYKRGGVALITTASCMSTLSVREY